MCEDDDVREHVAKFMDTVDKLQGINIEINGDLLSTMLLYSLPSSFENFRCSIESRDTRSLPNVENLKVKIIEENDARNQKLDGSSTGGVMFSKHFSRDSNFQAKNYLQVPSCLKVSRVVPLHKKGDPNNLTNYRPISIVPVMAKIIEKILFEQLYEYSETKYILSPFQFGFRQGRCTTSAIQELVSRVISGFENSKYVGGTFCDLSKAFDCVSPRILIEKLKFYGISGTSLDLINSYLSDRTQATQYKQNISSVVKLKYGVPQGSVLGPLLVFIFYQRLT
jgi:hypothetical protein